MKNLYKIEDELYIVSNTEDVGENCWIITSGRLVQVSYLLSDEVAKGFKVILTTNKLLIKDGVQAIDDEFLEWFVKNPNCEWVEIKDVYFNGSSYYDANQLSEQEKVIYYSMKEYKIMIPKEEPKQECFVTKCMQLDAEIAYKSLPKQETLEEAAEKACPIFNRSTPFGSKYPWTPKKEREAFIKGAKWKQEQEKITTDDAYNEGFENGKHWQQERSYSEEEVHSILNSFKSLISSGYNKPYFDWFEQFKKK